MTTTEPAYAARGTRRRMKAAVDERAAKVESEVAAATEAIFKVAGVIPPARDGFTALTEPPTAAPGLPAPWDGKPVMLVGDWTNDSHELRPAAVGHWRWTREFRAGRFRERGLWAKHLTAGVPLGFEPVAWRRLDE